ncbi:MAG TPA: hypothetical protein VIK86_05510 [Candidatus Paceibacterota bacterium]
MKTSTEYKNKIAMNNNFDSFQKAIRYMFNRKLLHSEEDFINQLFDEAIKQAQIDAINETVIECYKNARTCTNKESTSIIVDKESIMKVSEIMKGEIK